MRRRKPPKSLERWNEVPGWSGYWVSDLGRVWSEKAGRELKQEIVNGGGWSSQGRRKQGYRRVMVQRPGKRQKIYVHVLVCMAFIEGYRPSRGRLYQIDHINSDPADNSLENLRVLTVEDNQRKRSEYCVPASSRTPINPIDDFDQFNDDFPPFCFELGEPAQLAGISKVRIAMIGELASRWSAQTGKGGIKVAARSNASKRQRAKRDVKPGRSGRNRKDTR